MGQNRNTSRDSAPSWVIWWIAWGAFLCWPYLVWRSDAGIWGSIAWCAFLLAAGLALNAVKPRRRK